MLKRILLMPLTKRSMIPLIVVVLFAGGTWIGMQLQKSGSFQRTAVLAPESKADRPAKQAANPPRSTSTARPLIQKGNMPVANNRNVARLRSTLAPSVNQSQFTAAQPVNFKPLASPPRQNFSDGRFNVNSQVNNSSPITSQSQPRQVRIASLPPSTSTFSRPQPDNTLFAKPPKIQTPAQQSFAGTLHPKNAPTRPIQNANNRLPQAQSGFAPQPTQRPGNTNRNGLGFSQNNFGNSRNFQHSGQPQPQNNAPKQFADGHWAFSLKNSQVVTADLTNPIEFEIETKYGIVNVNSEELVAFHVVAEKKKVALKKPGQKVAPKSVLASKPPPHPTAFEPPKPSPAPTTVDTTKIVGEGSQITNRTTDSVLDELLDIVNEADPSGKTKDIEELLGDESDNQPAAKLLKDVQTLIQKVKDTKSKSNKSEDTNDSEAKDAATEAESKYNKAPSKQDDAPKPSAEPDYRPDVMVATKTGEIFTGKCTIKPIEVNFAWGTGTVNPESINFFANRENGIFGIQKDPATKSMFLRKIVIAQAVKHLQNGDRVR